jgi:voltage-gated potassium channel
VSENQELGKSQLSESELKSVYLITYEEDLKEIKNTLRNDFFAICLILIIGTASMGIIEDWDFIKSIYWCCVTITTVGYGDVVPETRAGKIFTIFYAIFGCGALAKSISSLVRYPLLIRERNSEIVLLNQVSNNITIIFNII